MRIVVCVKQVYDPATVKISRSREELDLRLAARQTNPSDRYALEQALRLREQAGGEVIALTVGDAEAEEVLREAVAIGADRGVLLSTPQAATIGGAGTARAVVAGLARLGNVDLVLTGQASVVSGTGSLPGRLAALLHCPVVLDAQCLEDEPDGSVRAVVPGKTQGIGNGEQETDPSSHAPRLTPYSVDLALPAVASIAPGRPRPRYAHAARIANAYRKELVETWQSDDLGLDPAALAPDTELRGLVLGQERTPGEVLGGTLDEAAARATEILARSLK